MTNLERWKAWKANPTPENRDAFLEPYLYIVKRFNKEMRGAVWLALEHALRLWNPEKSSFRTHVEFWIKSYAHKARVETYSDALVDFTEFQPTFYDVGDDLDFLRDLLRGYKQRDRYIVIARICGDSVEQIAATIGRTADTVRLVLKRVKKKFPNFKPVEKREATRARGRKRYWQMTEAQREKHRERSRLWRLEHPDRIKELQAKYYQKNRDAIIRKNKIGKRRFAMETQ